MSAAEIIALITAAMPIIEALIAAIEQAGNDPVATAPLVAARNNALMSLATAMAKPTA